ncbi:MAG: 5'/3'-nucleotidase SurE [Bacteroidia bacterium]|nr:MAG: 5'/3'-nucleotidase SurE [Bacteroidia bacterium]
MNREKPLILVSNDDGIDAKGIGLLATAMADLGEVWVVAPAQAQSGMSQALTAVRPLRMKELDRGRPYREFSVDGTPVDCVKLALWGIVPRQPDLVVAGINHGSNGSINVLYSGTMGATLEGCIAGIPSIGYSQVGRRVQEKFQPYVQRIARNVLERGLPQGVCLNVNLPQRPFDGEVRVCRQANARFDNTYEQREDPFGKPYYWLCDSFRSLEYYAPDTDDMGLREGCITIVPTMIDLTHRATMEELQTWEWGA